MTAPIDAVDEIARPDPSEKARVGGVLLEWIGAEQGSWEQWHLPGEGPAILLPPSKVQPKNSRRVLALPSANVYAWPLWISEEGDPMEHVRLELSGRHLIKRGMEDSLRMRTVTSSDGRLLVVAFACEEPFPEEGLPENWRQADHYELRPNLLNAPDADLVIWRENGLLYASFQRDGTCVWFCPLRDHFSGDLLLRTSLRLLSEGILFHSVLTIDILTETTPDTFVLLQANFPKAMIETGAADIPGRFPLSKAVDLTPSAAMSERLKIRQWQRIRQIASVAMMIYSLLLLWMAGDYLIHRHALDVWKKKVAALESAAGAAREQIQQWKMVRPAVDPGTYPLDLLAALATPTEGGKVRLTGFTFEKGKVQVSGEATDVTQAYGFIDQLKKNAALHEYDWNAGQPQIAGKNSVKFDIEGVRPDAAK